MTTSTVLVAGIKSRLRAQGLTYAELARRLHVSEPTVKRDLSRGQFSLHRLDRICEALGVGLEELLEPSGGALMSEMSEAQEQALVASPQLLLVTYLVVNHWKLSEITNTYRVDAHELSAHLVKLDKLRIIDFTPPARIRRLTARNFHWRKDGPVHEYFIRRVAPEFFDAGFDAPGDEFRFVAGMLSQSSRLRIRAALRRVAEEFESLAQQDARLPLEARDGCTAILALRQWELSAFSALRREPKPKRSR